MNRTFCDLCKRDVSEVDSAGESRFIDFSKIGKNLNTQEDETLPVHPVIETCVDCSEKAYKLIMDNLNK